MAEVNKIDALAKLLEAYATGVRGGVLTPCLEDEEEFRAMLGLKPASENVKADWAKSSGVRAPITLSRGTGATAVIEEKAVEDE
jgi:hypothetical protein